MDFIDQINTHKYLYLDKLVERNDLELEVWINEARVSQSERDILQNASAYGAIVTDEFCKRYKILFDNYIAFSVVNESFENPSDDQEFIGNLFRTYSKSGFLDYVLTSVTVGHAEEVFDSEIQHFEVNCLNHIINIATCKLPLIEELTN